VLDPTKPAVIVLLKVGFEPFERSLGPSEAWVKKGKDNFLTISGKLTKVKPTPASSTAPSAVPTPAEPKSALAPPPLAPKPEATAPSAEGTPKSDSTSKTKAKPAPDF
jgi:hypothetical protein